jgi:hypothetical protein
MPRERRRKINFHSTDAWYNLLMLVVHASSIPPRRRRAYPIMTDKSAARGIDEKEQCP